MDELNLSGALVGWKRTNSLNGIVLTVQLARTQTALAEQNLDNISLAMNDRQLRSLARDLQRAARDRGIDLWAKPSRFGFLRRL